MMTVKPVVMFFVLLVIMISTPFRWRAHLWGEVGGGGGLADHVSDDQLLVRRGATKDRIILTQERKIQQLIQAVWSYRQQLHSCQNRSRIYPLIHADTDSGD